MKYCSEFLSTVGLHSPGEEQQYEGEDSSGQDDLHLGVQPLLLLLPAPSQAESESNAIYESGEASLVTYPAILSGSN